MGAERGPTLLKIAADRSVRRPAFRIALVVGCVFAPINHGDRLLTLNLDGMSIETIALTFFIPCCVSTCSSVLAVRERLPVLS
ncbi:nitrate/nitrite transporter NrtS [Roseobacteraceae bacterium S113]